MEHRWKDDPCSKALRLERKLLQIDLIENYNKSLEFLKSLAAEELPTSLHVEDKDVALSMTGLYYLEIHSSLIDVD